MKHDYQKKITALLASAHLRLHATQQIGFKNVFGAVGGYVNGRIFCSCGKFGFALRLPPETLSALFRGNEAKHLKYFPNGHIKREYAVLSVRIRENKNRMKKLLNESTQYALSTPS